MFGTMPSRAFTASSRSLALPAADSGEMVLKRDTVTLARSRLGSGHHFQDDFQLDWRTERQARHTEDKARRGGLLAEDVAKQFRCGVGDLRVLRELRRRG